MQHEIEAKIVSIATGAEFSVLLDSKGKVANTSRGWLDTNVLSRCGLLVTLRMELLGTMMMASSWPKPTRYCTHFMFFSFK